MSIDDYPNAPRFCAACGGPVARTSEEYARYACASCDTVHYLNPKVAGGVIVVSAPDERALAKLLRRLDRLLFRKRQPRPVGAETLDVVGGPPLLGLKLHADVGWPGSAAR